MMIFRIHFIESMDTTFRALINGLVVRIFNVFTRGHRQRIHNTRQVVCDRLTLPIIYYSCNTSKQLKMGKQPIE